MNTTPDDSEQTLSDMLRRLRAGENDSDARQFQLALHRKLVAAGPPAALGWRGRLREVVARHPMLAWPALGAAAGASTFALLLLVNGGRGTLGSQATQVATQVIEGHGGRGANTPGHQAAPGVTVRGPVRPTYTVPTDRVAVINLNFSADVTVQDVTFEVKLPDGLVFWSDGKALAERVFRWPGTLDVGDNLMPIAVRGQHPGLFRVAARAEIADQVVEHEILLRVEGGV